MRRRLARGVCAGLALATLLVAGACSSPQGGTVTTTGMGDNPVQLDTEFAEGFFAVEAAQTTVAFSTLPYEALTGNSPPDGEFLHIEVLWRPKAGSTAIVPAATNLSIRLVIVSGGEIGIYGGGGFAWIKGGTEEDDSVELQITGSSLSLIDHTPGFKDLLSPAAMLGDLGASRSAEKARAYCRAASQMVTNKLGRVRYVMAPSLGRSRS